MRYINYTVPKSNSFGHYCNSKSVDKLLESTRKFENLISKTLYKDFKVYLRAVGTESTLIKWTDLLKCLSGILGVGKIDKYESYIPKSASCEWTIDELDENLIKFIEKINYQDEDIKNCSIEISLRKSFSFEFKNHDLQYESYGENRKVLSSLISIEFGTNKIVQPRLSFPYSELDDKIYGIISEINKTRLFIFNERHLREVSFTKKGTTIARKIKS